jgi:hypothetical protein
MKLLGIFSVDFNITSITNQVFCIGQILEKKLEYNGTTSIIYRFKKAHDSIRRKVF